METRQKILELLFPKAVLQAMTPEARAAMPAVLQGVGMITVLAFPFRLGRESRVMMINNTVHRIERPTAPGSVPNNDIYLLDGGKLLQVSREHLQIDRSADGYVLTDRGSQCGASVNGKRIGAGTGTQSAPLHDGDLVVIGTAESCYRYTFYTDFGNTRW